MLLFQTAEKILSLSLPVNLLSCGCGRKKSILMLCAALRVKLFTVNKQNGRERQRKKSIMMLFY